MRSGPQRVNHAAAPVGERIFTFGGYSSVDMNLYLHKLPMDVHVLHIRNLQWREIAICSRNHPQFSVTPFLRYGHTAVAYGTKIYIWGGRNDQTACNRLFCFDTDTFLWSNPSTTGDIPCSRDGHSACIIGNSMYIFGGYEEEFERFSQDVFALNLETMNWTYVDTKGESPPYTDFHTGTAIGKRIYIFGGRSDRAAPHSSEEDFYPNDIMYLDTETGTWVRPAVSGNIPVGRRSHSAFLYRGKLYIFGGYNGILKEHYNDIHCFDPVACTWHQVNTFGVSPKKRRRQVCIVIKDKLYLFGGTSPSENPVAFGRFVNPEDFHREQELNLVDHDDLHVLDMNPSLQTLCKLCIIKHDICDHYLPDFIRQEIKSLKLALLIDV